MYKYSSLFFAVGSLILGPSIGHSVEMTPYGAGYMKNKEGEIKLVVHNRILVKIHDRIISVLDLQKAMDLFLHEHYPDALHSEVLKYQYYAKNWRVALQEMINVELMKMEAEELEYKIPDADIHQEMTRRFGPNVIQKLDEYGLTHEEAKELIRDEILSRNLSWFRVWARTNQLVSPEVLRKAYEDHVQSLSLSDSFGYQTLTIRGPESDTTGAVSKTVADYLTAHPNSTFTDVIGTLSENIPTNVTLHISQMQEVKSRDLTPEYFAILERLPINAFSQPFEQVSRTDGAKVYRIFQMQKLEKATPPNFEDLVDQLRNQLFEKYGSKQREEYLAKLRKHFCCEDLVVSELFPHSYQPFTIT